MTNIDKRLAALEQMSPVTFGEAELDYLEWLSLPSFPQIVVEFAERRARRTIAGDGWRRLTDEERRARVRVEILRLSDLDPIDWPAGDAESFARRLADHRSMLDAHRAWEGVFASAWRAQHRDWHARMSEAEFDAWERSRMRQT